MTAAKPEAAFLADALHSMLASAAHLPADELIHVIDIAGQVLGATSARLLVADYALLSLQELGDDGPTGVRQMVEGTMAGRAFSRDEIVVAGDTPALVFIPLAEGCERIGVLELTHEHWSSEIEDVLGPVVRLLVLIIISKRRYTDVVLRSRRSEPLSVAAEVQWGLLPPLTCSTDCVSISGILEPAYSIGGDSFDYALNPGHAEFAIVDAVGHGIAAVMMSAAAINALRNARREGLGLEAAYHATGDIIETQFGRAGFVTGQIGSLTYATGELTWINAGHPLPLLVRDGSFVGELDCRPSLPMGLGGPLVQVASERLQPGDRVLFYTDGVIESRAPNGDEFGVARLADFLVRATNDGVPPNETVRRLSATIVAHNAATLRDDATLLLVEHHACRAT